MTTWPGTGAAAWRVGQGCGAALLIAALALPAAALAQAPEPSGSNLGGVGLIEMRNARFRPDGTLEVGASIRRQRDFYFLSFQALPFLETTFRLADRLNGTIGRDTVTDRSFDVKLRVWEEDDWRPALALGLQDAIGTGLYSGEYLVASKRLWDFDVTLGLGWGRLGTGDDLRNPLGLTDGQDSSRPRRVGQGGTPSFGSFFRGREAAVFGGVEWSVPALATPFGEVEGLRAKVEWSGDALRDERGGFPARGIDTPGGLRGEARSRLNAGLQWQPNPFVDAGVHWLHGTDVLFRLSLRMDPANPPLLVAPEAPPRLAPRPETPGTPEDLAGALRAAGFRTVAASWDGAEARITVEGGRFATLPQVAGRVARAAQPFLPREVERLRLEWRRVGVTVARVVLLRASLEAAVRGQGSAEEVLAGSALLPADPDDPPRLDPAPSYGIEPRILLSLGEPRAGVRWQAGLAAGGRLGLGDGYAVAGSVAQAIVGNLDRAISSDSVLPHVRSDFGRYAREGQTSIPALYGERIWLPAPDVFARVTAGLLEPMFAGVSTEVLWRPFDRPLALGLDLNWVAQREYRQRFSTLGYQVATGHASIYADLPLWNLYGVLRAGRYLAGDWGGTLELGRRFDSGVEVGAFATLTDVPFRRFGEGSFDKGIYVRVPLAVFGPATAARATALIRPVVRDGGARLAVDNPLWEIARDGRTDAFARGYQGFLR